MRLRLGNTFDILPDYGDVGLSCANRLGQVVKRALETLQGLGLAVDRLGKGLNFNGIHFFGQLMDILQCLTDSLGNLPRHKDTLRE